MQLAVLGDVIPYTKTTFELAGSGSIEVEFVVTAEEEQGLLDLIRREKVRIFFTRIPARFGIINPDAKDLPSQRGDD